MSNYYEILQLDKKCNQDDIKKSYRKLALQYHPDRNKEPGSEEKFKEISEAYEILSDLHKKKQYDNQSNMMKTNINPHDLFHQFFKHNSPNVRMNVSNMNSVFHSRSNVNSIQKSTIFQNGQVIETIIEIINGEKKISKKINGRLVENN